ncbi:hypothetical protein ACP70R_010214 [Stipagrostis hirtigluma subsp. patula]
MRIATREPGPPTGADLEPFARERTVDAAAVHRDHPLCLFGINAGYKNWPPGWVWFSLSPLLPKATVSVSATSRLLQLSLPFTWLMASPAAASGEFTQQEAARQSLIAISQSVPEIGAQLAVRSPDGGMANVHDEGVAAEKYRTKLISISNQSPDARPAPCPTKNGVAY